MLFRGPQDTEGSLRRDVERLRDMMEAIPNAIILVSASGCVEMMNAQAERLFEIGRAHV